MKRFSATTHKIKLWLARTFGWKCVSTGLVEEYKLTFGGAGNQWTMIDGELYATYWDWNTKDWNVGDQVEFVLFFAPLRGRGYPCLQATDIKKVKTDPTLPWASTQEPLFV